MCWAGVRFVCAEGDLAGVGLIVGSRFRNGSLTSRIVVETLSDWQDSCFV